MNQDQIYKGLQEIFEKTFKRTDILVAPTLSAKDVPGWDSFRQISLIIATEEHFGIRFLDAELDKLHNIGDLVDIVAKRLGPN